MVAADLGDRGFGVVLDGDIVCVYVQPITGPGLDSRAVIDVRFTRRVSVVSRTSIKRLHEGQFKRMVASEVLIGASQ